MKNFGDHKTSDFLQRMQNACHMKRMVSYDDEILTITEELQYVLLELLKYTGSVE